MEYQYAQLPKTISFKSINNSVLSSGTYRYVKFGNGVITKKLKSLLTTQLSKSHLGQEVGSSAYISTSTHFLYVLNL